MKTVRQGGIALIFLVAVIAAGCTITNAGLNSNVFVIHLIGNLPPVASYKGGINGYPATAPPATGPLGRQRRSRVNVAAAHVQSYASFLRSKQLQVIADVNLTRAAVLYSYEYALNGFAAKIQLPSIIQRLKQHPLVAAVNPMTTVKTSLNRSPTFLQLQDSLWKAEGGQTNAGKGVVVGVIDTGIWPENPFFSDAGMKGATPPQYWAGSCTNTADFPASACNSKLIGAKFFAKGAMATGPLDLASDWLSPRDAAGHGTWCAGASAGAANVPIVKNGSNLGTASGIAPGAFLAMYKVFWTTPNLEGQATDADLIAAVNQAIIDGVDVLSCSWGAPASDKSLYGFDYIFMNAAQAGIFTSIAAGNDGPPPGGKDRFTVLSNIAPFYMTVGATTIDRAFQATFKYGTTTLNIPSEVGMPASPVAQLVSSSDAAANGVGSASAAICSNNTLDAAKVTGKIVVCQRGVVFFSDKIDAVKKAGGVGIVVINVAGGKASVLGFTDSFPGAHLTVEQAAVLQKYMQGNPLATAQITAGATVTGVDAPFVASFSSRGPTIAPSDRSSRINGLTNSILKPDILGPGVNLWSAAPADSLSSTIQQFAMLSGTSMATPHLAGIAAMVVSANPSWTPAMVRSALMTTAYQTTTSGKPIPGDDGGAVDAWSTGSGHVDCTKVLNPGLVYDAGYTDYVNFMYGRYPVQARLLFPGLPYHAVDASNLNYPNIMVSNVVLPRVTVTRMVTNVLNVPSTFVASVVEPPNAKVTVSPPTLTIQGGGTATFTVTFTITSRSDNFEFGSLTWANQAGNKARSVLGVQATNN